jgi:hypothetical protein
MGGNGIHVLSLSFLSFGPSREEGWIGFLFLSLGMDGGNNGRAWSFLKNKNRSLVRGGGRLRFIGKSHVS